MEEWTDFLGSHALFRKIGFKCSSYLLNEGLTRKICKSHVPTRSLIKGTIIRKSKIPEAFQTPLWKTVWKSLKGRKQNRYNLLSPWHIYTLTLSPESTLYLWITLVKFQIFNLHHIIHISFSCPLFTTVTLQYIPQYLKTSPIQGTDVSWSCKKIIKYK